MDGYSTQLVLKVLDGLSTRATVTAQNIANAGTPGYRPLQVSFERALAEAAARGPGALAEAQPELGRTPANSSGGALRLDLELATASSTALRYSALIELLNRQMQIDALAVTGGN